MVTSQIHEGDAGANWAFYGDVVRRLQECRTVLNLGSGTYFLFERLLRSAAPTARIYSVDNAESSGLPEVTEFLSADLTSPDAMNVIGLEPESIDAVTCFEVLEHLANPDLCLRLAFELLRPNGKLIVSVPNLGSFFGRFELALGFQPHVLEVSTEVGPLGMGPFGAWNYSQSHPLNHIRGFTLRGLRALLEHHGFEVEAFHGYASSLPWWPKRRLVSLAPQLVAVMRKA